MEYTIYMYILQVVPLIKLPGQMSHTLTYYSSEEILPGSLVIVEVRTTYITAIIYFCQELTKDRQNLRKFAQFSPKPIEKSFSNNPLLTENQLQLAEWISNYYAHPLGNIIKWFLPRLSSKIKRYPKILEAPTNKIKFGDKYTPKLIIYPTPARLKHYHKVIRQTQGQILILTPDNISLEIITKELEKYNPVTINSQIKTSEFRKIWTKIKSGEAKVIIGNRIALFLPFQNLEHIIIEDEASEAYYSFETKPHYQTTTIASQLAKLHQANLTLASNLPSINSLDILEKNNLSLPAEFYPDNNHLKTKLIEMPIEFTKGNKELLSIPAQKAIRQAIDKNQSIIIYINRRGESLYMSCRDCGYHLRDPKSGSLLTVHRVDTLAQKVPNYIESQILMSHTSRKWFKMIHQCPQCKSYNLKQGGIGIQKIQSMIQELYPQIPSFILSSDTASDVSTQKDIIDKFIHSNPAILLSTSMIHKFLDIIPKTLTIIPSAESLINFPDYSIREKSIQVLTELIQNSHKTLIQTFTTWNREEELPTHIYNIINRPIAELWQQEYQNRQLYQYPPHYEIIAIHSQHSYRDKALSQALRVKTALHNISIKALGPLEKYLAKGKGIYQFTLIIQSTPKQAQSIKSKLVPILERGQDIEINPQNLL
jgi:primosomal protein N' (replication factor Y) (superfamily II helicase)